VALAPDDPDLWHALALVQYRGRDPEAAAGSARAALARDPNHAGAHVALAECLLLRGAYAPGWEEYEWRYRLPGATPPVPPLGCPAWDGAPLPAGQLLLVADQGYGDAIQFARYLPWVAGRVAGVALVAAPELAPLLAPLLAGNTMLTGWAAVAAWPSPFVAWAPLSGLPRLHGTRLASIPCAVPYLTASPLRTAAWQARLDALAPRPQRRVGVVWAGRATHPNDANRSAPPAALALLATVPGVRLVSVQQGPAAAGSAAIAPGLPELGSAIGDFAEAAAALTALDLLITVDSAPAHLAGALGRPAWVLLPYGPDWRWLLDRADSPWYPTARLFRPESPHGNHPHGDGLRTDGLRDDRVSAWAGVASAVAAALLEWAAGQDRADARSGALPTSP
ncbi:MAG: glycosyltransferase family 9 protein, partial [Acetobacteraceae bacterium]